MEVVGVLETIGGLRTLATVAGVAAGQVAETLGRAFSASSGTGSGSDTLFPAVEVSNLIFLLLFLLLQQRLLLMLGRGLLLEQLVVVDVLCRGDDSRVGRDALATVGRLQWQQKRRLRMERLEENRTNDQKNVLPRVVPGQQGNTFKKVFLAWKKAPL